MAHIDWHNDFVEYVLFHCDFETSRRIMSDRRDGWKDERAHYGLSAVDMADRWFEAQSIQFYFDSVTTKLDEEAILKQNPLGLMIIAPEVGKGEKAYACPYIHDGWDFIALNESGAPREHTGVMIARSTW